MQLSIFTYFASILYTDSCEEQNIEIVTDKADNIRIKTCLNNHVNVTMNSNPTYSRYANFYIFLCNIINLIKCIFRLERDLYSRTDQFGVEMRERAKADIREAMVGTEVFEPKHIIVATWKNVSFAGGIPLARRTVSSSQNFLFLSSSLNILQMS